MKPARRATLPSHLTDTVVLRRLQLITLTGVSFSRVLSSTEHRAGMCLASRYVIQSDQRSFYGPVRVFTVLFKLHLVIGRLSTK